MPKIDTLVRPLLDWFALHARALPWRLTTDPYAIWVSEVMLQQTQVKTVIPYWERWMKQFPTSEALAAAPLVQVLKLWEGLGYYTRARNLHRAAQLVLTKHGGAFPSEFEAVLALPGIGRYTAGAICSIAFDQATPILDGNVMRVLTRLFALGGNPRSRATSTELWHLAAALVSCAAGLKQNRERPCAHLNQALMELGATVCTPRNPNCERCPVRRFCLAREQNAVARYPNLGKRVVSTERECMAFVVQTRNRYLVRQRPAGGVNAHLWEFPNVGLDGERLEPRSVAPACLGFAPENLAGFCSIKHTITRYRITLQVLHVTLARGFSRAGISGSWLTLEELDTLAFPSAHRRILSKLLQTKPHTGSGHSNYERAAGRARRPSN